MAPIDPATLSTTAAYQILDLIVEREGEDTIQVCNYRDEDNNSKPVCLVGHFLNYVGLLHNPVVIEGHDAGSIWRQLGGNGPVAELLWHVQNIQDSGYPWGDALHMGYSVLSHQARSAGA